ncbi:Phosphorylase kinase [Aphelenchoides fujianensis]|nr:Phosphorylase kinase [Aphelenchoides fujianensis]
MANDFANYDSDDDATNDEAETASAIMESCAGFYSSYECKEVLGHGIASTVRRCVEKSTGPSSEHEAKRLADETLSEVSLLRLLAGHESIISIHDFFSTPTFLFAVFEMAPGGELFHLLNKSVTLSEKKTRQIMRQLFNGVSYMHSKNIVHRDLKLENVLCIDDRRVVISDFGFAKQLKPNERLKELFGTPGYLAPETLRCQMYEDAVGYSYEVDNWALGVIMYTLLAGYAPFYHRQQLRMMRLIQEGKYEFAKEAWESISVDAKKLRGIDREELRKRPFRNREIRHEAEAAAFAVFGHWVNRGFHYSRDVLFSNKPRPVYVQYHQPNTPSK